LRATSRDTVDGARPSRAAMARHDSPGGDAARDLLALGRAELACRPPAGRQPPPARAHQEPTHVRHVGAEVPRDHAQRLARGATAPRSRPARPATTGPPPSPPCPTSADDSATHEVVRRPSETALAIGSPRGPELRDEGGLVSSARRALVYSRRVPLGYPRLVLGVVGEVRGERCGANRLESGHEST
jgi:hypothetical protein